MAPLAFGLIQVGAFAAPAERAAGRVMIGAFAAAEGFALVEVFEVTGEPVRDESALAALERLAIRCEASRLLVLGDVRSSRLMRLIQATGMAPHQI